MATTPVPAPLPRPSPPPLRGLGFFLARDLGFHPRLHDVAPPGLKVRELVTACGYGRREREVAWLGKAMAGG